MCLPILADLAVNPVSYSYYTVAVGLTTVYARWRCHTKAGDDYNRVRDQPFSKIGSLKLSWTVRTSGQIIP